MNAIETLLDKPIFQALGWTLIHFIWQGTLIAVLFASVSVLLRRFTANVRYAAACGAMLLMLIAPAATMFAISAATDSSLARRLTAETAPGDQTVETVAETPAGQLMPVLRTDIEAAPVSQPNAMMLWAQDRLPRAMPWLLALWFTGVLFLSLRLAGGLVMVQRLKRIETSANVQLWPERLAELSHRLRVSRPVRLCESALVEVPTVIGWLRPVILLPASALTGLSAEQLEALLAHELAHIRRYDYLVNLLQTSIETLFFYHPAVWWVSAQVRQEREHCCDDLAVAACGDVLTYARALTALERLRGSEPQLAVAATGGSLLVRIHRLLRGRAPAFYGFESGLAGFIALATIFMLLAGVQTALLSRNAKAAVKDADVLKLSDMNTRAADQTADMAGRVEHRTADRVATPPTDATPIDEGASAQEPSNPASDTAPQDERPGDSRDFISEMAAVGLTNLKVDQLVALKVSGVTAQFVREISASVPTRMTVDRLVAMRIHGVTTAFAEELKAQGLASLSADQLIAFRIHGVTSQYVNELKNAGYGNATPDLLVAFRIHGVTPAFIKELEILGYTNLTANQLMAFRIHGVTPSFIRSIQEAGYDRITADQLMELRIFGVTPEFIQLVKSRGFTDVTLHQLAELRRLNILPSAKKN